MLLGAKLSRKSLSDSIGPSRPSGDSILAKLEQQTASLTEDHEGFMVMDSFWMGIVGEHSEVTCQAEVLASLPAEGRSVTKAQAIAASDALERCTFFSFIGLGPRALFETAMAFVTAIRAGRQPSFEHRSSVFMQNVMSACAHWYLDRSVVKHGADLDDLFFRGRQAHPLFRRASRHC